MRARLVWGGVTLSQFSPPSPEATSACLWLRVEMPAVYLWSERNATTPRTERQAKAAVKSHPWQPHTNTLLCQLHAARRALVAQAQLGNESWGRS